jgi:phosphoadenosine phosphosulfate reductase
MSRTASQAHEVITRLAARFAGATLAERLRLVRAEIQGRVVFTTSFGIEDQAIAHALFSEGLDVEVVTLDTGRLFPETHEVWAATERRYGTRIRGLAPEQQSVEALVARDGIDGIHASLAARHACCHVRKVVPLGRALAGAAGWITGLRADQSAGRAQAEFVAYEQARGLVKINPLLDWSRPQVVDFVRAHAVPYNALHDRGFLSIGCAPCTRAVAPGEPERAGRWWWEQEDKKECGLHVAREMRRPAPVAEPALGAAK